VKTPLAIVAIGALLAAMPWLGLPPFYDSFLYLVLSWVVLATSWNILSGYAGYFSFGHGAFFGAGLYTTTTLAAKADWPFLWTLPVAAGVAALLGLGLGAVVFRVKRVRGELFALLTLAVTFVLATIVLNTPIDGGPGVYLNSVPVPALGPTQAGTFYLLALGAAVGTLLIAWSIVRSRFGAGLFAIHDDEDAAEVLGVPTYRYKLFALAISAGLAGVAGGIHALFISYVTASEVFSITVPLTVVLMSVLGGTRHWLGPAVGAAVITVLLYSFTAADYAVAGKAMMGAVLIATILFMPDGILLRVLKLFGGRPAAASRGATAPLSANSATPGTADASQATASTASIESPSVGLNLPESTAPIPASLEALDRPRAAPPSRPTAGAPTDVLLRVDGLSKAFKGVKALAGVDVEVRSGEILGLLGPNGSGKSTFINVVSGHFPASGGRIAFEGREIGGLPAHRIAQSGIARTYQIPRPFAHLTVLANVALVAMFGGAALDRESAEREARRWLEFTGLQDRADVLPDALNLHQRKFLELARALAAKPRLVLLDEVLSGLTPGEINEAVALIRRIRERGATIVFVEHVMRAVMALADRIAVLDHGKLIAIGAPAQVMRDPAVLQAYLGQAHAQQATGTEPRHHA
jgi:branched-chain amino acid transport system permease protein